MVARPAHFRPPEYSAARPSLVRPVRLDPSGETGPTPRQARGRGWRRSSHGFYVPADVDADAPMQRVLEASVRLPAHAAVTGWAALPLLDENAWSPPEVDLRLAWEELGIRDVVCNHPVFDLDGGQREPIRDLYSQVTLAG